MDIGTIRVKSYFAIASKIRLTSRQFASQDAAELKGGLSPPPFMLITYFRDAGIRHAMLIIATTATFRR